MYYLSMAGNVRYYFGSRALRKKKVSWVVILAVQCQKTTPTKRFACEISRILNIRTAQNSDVHVEPVMVE